LAGDIGQIGRSFFGTVGSIEKREIGMKASNRHWRRTVGAVCFSLIFWIFQCGKGG
jgi:hypothetical protein